MREFRDVLRIATQTKTVGSWITYRSQKPGSALLAQEKI